MKKFTLALAFLFICLILPAQKPNQVHYKVYSNYQLLHIPDFDTLGKPDYEGYINNFAWFGVPGANCAHFAGILEGKLRVNKAENYTFHLAVDDGAILYVDGKAVINMDSLRSLHSKEATLFLEKGNHILRIEYYNYLNALQVKLLYSTPSFPYRTYYAIGDKIPNFVRKEAQETYRRYKQWKGDDETIVFPLITDIHTAGSEKHKQVDFVVATDRTFNYDFMVNLGDIGINDPINNKTIEATQNTIDIFRKAMEEYKGVFLFAPGNHDWDGGAGTHITSAQLSELFQQPFVAKSNGKYHIVKNKCYGYYDLTEKNTRFILLNSEGTETIGTYYAYDDEQLKWLKETLKSTPKTMNVVVMSHLCPMMIGRWYNNGKLEQPNFTGAAELQQILSTYKAQGGKLIAVLCGDSHVNACATYDGVTYFISQGGGGDMGIENMQSCQRRAWPDYTKTLCCDIIAFKPATGEMRSFRMGSGGAEMDYEIAK